MSNEITIGNETINRIEWKNQLVITTAEIAKYHELDVRIINQKFRRNKENFILDKDYFIVTRDISESHRVIQDLFVVNNQTAVYLFTESGYLRFVKTINDEKAWKAYNVLIESYFLVKRLNNSEKIFLEKSKENRKGLTEEWKNHEARDYRSLTISEYDSLFNDCSIRKRDMNDKDLMLLSAFEFLEQRKLENNEDIKGDKMLKESMIDTGLKINSIVRKSIV